jgi:hypothetical protein
MPKKTKRIMRAFKLDEISAVTTPAQGAATMAIMKRKDEGHNGEPVTKVGMLLTDVDGHSHLIYNIEEMSGTTSWSIDLNGNDHNHPWMKDMEGNIVVGAAAGHTHKIVKKVLAAVSVNEYGKQDITIIDAEVAAPDTTQETEKMTKTVEAQLEEAQAELAKAAEDKAAMEARIAKAEAVAALTDVEKAHFDALEGEAKDAFLAKSGEDRKADIAKAADADAVIYTARDGSEFRKSDDPRLIAMAKKMDADAEALAKAKAEAEEATFTKAAESEYAGLPGEVAHRVALLKAVDGIEDADTKAAVQTMLKAQASALAKSEVTIGTSATKPTAEGGPGEAVSKADANAKLEKLAIDYAKEHDITKEKAMVKVLETEEGAQLYEAVA